MAREQKRLIKILLVQGWSKNEIIFEMQRVFGQDVLIDKKYLDDERSLATKVMPYVGASLLFTGLLLRKQVSAR